jgi:hypothetical protein
LPPHPLIDFPPGGTYKGLEGGLYGRGSNVPLAAHHAAGLQAAAGVQPIDGRIVMLAIGPSVVGDETRAYGNAYFTGKEPKWTRGNILLVNAGGGGMTTEYLDTVDDEGYVRARDRVLAPQGVTEAEVQVVWVKIVHQGSNRGGPLPGPDADAILLGARCEQMIASMRVHYPNLKQVFVTSRNYGGYASGDREPWEYETGFAARSCILAHQGRTDPWVGWGPYLWADGATPRSDGLFWVSEDFEDDGKHAGPTGEAKIAALLEALFQTSPYTPWFRGGS